MMNGMYAAIGGLQANETMLNVTANNLANVNTIGYKSARVTFAESLAQVVRGSTGITATNGGTNPVQVGLSVQVASTDNLMTEGSFQSTNNLLDVAIQGEGFLRVGAGSPTAEPPYTAKVPTGIQYTRQGDLTTNAKGFLTTQNGNYVIGREAVAVESETGTTYTPGASDTYIVIPPGSANVSIGQDGSVTYTDEKPESPTFEKQVTAGYISLAKFPNQNGLQRLGSSLWGPTANTGAPVVGTPNTGAFGQTVAGELEMSNVDLATEMTNMITAQRGYQANSKVISTADTMLETVVTMVR
jgi:flagellar hook protein FlgE